MTNKGSLDDDAGTSDIAKQYMRMLREYESQNGDNGDESASAARH